MNGSTPCALCGLPTPDSAFRENEDVFCCFGCREVHRHFGKIRTEPPEPAPAEPSDTPGREAFLRVEEMHCSSCELRIDRTVARVAGVLEVTSSYATSTVRIVYDPDRLGEAELPGIVGRAGYRAHLCDDKLPEYDERPLLLRLVVGASLAATVMMLYLAVFYPIHLGLVDAGDLEPIGSLAFEVVPVALLVLTSGLVFYVAVPIFRGAWIGLATGLLNMDNLLAIAILAAYGYSVGQLLRGTTDLYFDVVAAIIAVVTIGRYFERQARIDATGQLSGILKSWMSKVRVYRQDALQFLSLDQLLPGDRILVHEGEPIPVDGTIVDGQGAIDESLMTGEPFPITRQVGARAIGGSRLVEGSIEIQIGHSVESRMRALASVLWRMQSTTAGMRRISDRIAVVFVPVVLALAVVVTLSLYGTGTEPSAALLAGMATLIVSCPCTFGLAIPLASAAGVIVALRNGVIVTGADVFEKDPSTSAVFVVDRTGVLSSGMMRVEQVLGPAEVAEIAAAVERASNHPIAVAIRGLGSQRTASEPEIRPGKGVIASVDGLRAAVGSRSLFESLGWAMDADVAASAQLASDAAAIVSYVGWDGRIRGAIVTSDSPREDWLQFVRGLRRQARVVLLTGAASAHGYADEVDEAYVGLPPQGKAAVIEGLKTGGRVVMIGDGSNDALALAAADLGVAFGSPTELAAEAADMVVVGDRLERVFTALELVRTVRRRIRQNLGWALMYNAIAIPLAVSGQLNPLFAALAMSASSLLVIWNSSRSMVTNDRTPYPLPVVSPG